MKPFRKIRAWFKRRRVEKWLLLEYEPVLPEPYEGYNELHRDWHNLHREHVRFFSGEWSDKEKATIDKQRALLGNPPLHINRIEQKE